MLTVIIVCYNSAETIIKCQNELLSSGRFPIIVVDNASSDGSADALELRYSSIQVMRMKQNLGYGRAANRALAKVTTPYAFLLNPDLIADVESVNAMLVFSEANLFDASLFAPAVVKKDHLNCGPVSRDWVSGSALFLKMSDFISIGFFDENIFLFYEETDLCRRLVAAGKRILLNTDVYINHLKGQSSKPNAKIEALKDWHFGWSKMYYLIKHQLINGWWASRYIYFKYFIKSLISVTHFNRKKNANRASGVLAYIRGEEAFLSDGSAQKTGVIG